MESRNKTYESVLAVLLLLLLLYYFFWTTKLMITGIIVFLVTTLVFSVIADYVALVWTKLTQGIGFVMNHVLMTVVFLAILTPIALVYRLTQSKKATGKSSKDSAFIDRNHLFVSKDIESPW
jgi:hypothetical protein